MAEKIGTDAVGLARFSVSRNGVLAYRTGDSGNRLLWMDRAGKELETAGPPGDYGNPALSRAGDRLAFNASDPRSGKFDIWVRDLARGVNSRFTFAAGVNICPLWSPDGSRIVFTAEKEGASSLLEKASTGQGEEKPLLKSTDGRVLATDWSRDGKYIAYSHRGKEGWDVFVLPTAGDRKPIPVVQSPFNDLNGMFSPDGRFIAYQSNESGRAEVYVQTFPDPGGKWQISTAGGVDASWRADGKEIFFRAPDQKLMAVDVQTAGNFQAGIPQPLFLGRVPPGASRNRYSPAADGQRFLYVAPLGRESMTPTTVILNWFEGLEH